MCVLFRYTYAFKSLRRLINVVQRNKIDYLLLIRTAERVLYMDSKPGKKSIKYLADGTVCIKWLGKKAMAATTKHRITWKNESTHKHTSVYYRARTPLDEKKWRVLVQLMSIFHVFPLSTYIHLQAVKYSAMNASYLYNHRVVPWCILAPKTWANFSFIFSFFRFWRHHNFPCT